MNLKRNVLNIKIWKKYIEESFKTGFIKNSHLIVFSRYHNLTLDLYKKNIEFISLDNDNDNDNYSCKNLNVYLE